MIKYLNTSYDECKDTAFTIYFDILLFILLAKYLLD